MAVTTQKESEKQEAGNRTMGRKELVTYALYELHGYINPFLAQQTGFNEDDLELFFTALEQMFEHDHSASRGEMGACSLIVFKHDTPLSNAPARKLFNLIDIRLNDGVEVPQRFEDYLVSIDEQSKPNGVTIVERI